MYKKMIPLALVVLLSAEPALAYVGPGSSLGAVGVVFGLIGTLFLSLVSFIWYPVKRLHRKLRKQMARQQDGGVASPGKSRS
jgi:hypothetical protein